MAIEFLIDDHGNRLEIERFDKDGPIDNSTTTAADGWRALCWVDSSGIYPDEITVIIDGEEIGYREARERYSDRISKIEVGEDWQEFIRVEPCEVFLIDCAESDILAVMEGHSDREDLAFATSDGKPVLWIERVDRYTVQLREWSGVIQAIEPDQAVILEAARGWVKVINQEAAA